ncbi:MAG: dienelactone hydrolase family protein [Clostridia bacterium]|nr:dienelactone hydrolase family protein [Clostridia bacterium]
MKTVKDISNELGFPYIAYIPDTVSENPSVIFHLHGAGERGDGTNLDAVLKNGLPQIANDNNLKDTILIMPQCPQNSFWVAEIKSLKLFFEACIEKYSVNRDKVFLCGLSMGGYGTWYTAMAFPQMFRAIAVCCGGGMPWNASVLTMPIWAFHGKEDKTVKPSETYDMVEALLKCNADVKYTYFDGVGHNSWKYAFTQELLEWFDSFK